MKMHVDFFPDNIFRQDDSQTIRCRSVQILIKTTFWKKGVTQLHYIICITAKSRISGPTGSLIRRGHVQNPLKSVVYRSTQNHFRILPTQFPFWLLVIHFQVFVIAGEIAAGHIQELLCHTLPFVGCQFTKIHEKIDPVTGATLELNPKALKAGDIACVTLTPMRPISVEAFSEYPSLGKFSMKGGRQTTVIGIIQSVVKKE